MKTVILCYHKIGSELEEGRWLNCAPETLGAHARFFGRKRWPGVLPRDFAAARPEGICFTFDDAYVSAVSNAPAILEDAGYRGAFYAVPSLVGVASNWDDEKARPLATWAELIRLSSRGHEIGNHTNSHPRMSELTLERQIQELAVAHQMLTDRGLDSRSVCYPYGSFNADTLAAVSSLGYQVGLKLAKRPVQAESALELNRVVVSFSDSLPKLLYKIYVRPHLP